MTFPPNRNEALKRLANFVPKSGSDYARLRNFDLGAGHHTHVSTLSPYIRHRVIREDEVIQAVLGHYSLNSAEKFIQEVFWRTYWKGWLELRPGVWGEYKNELQRNLNHLQTESGLRCRWEDACLGKTGIDCFDPWVKELTETGYLHNHARMWFASIWIFTLRLPWSLGADFFLRHLFDGDPASNTLSWRWVAGLQTPGKHYLARPDNIAKFTQRRFEPNELNLTAAPLSGPEHPIRQDLPAAEMTNGVGDYTLLLHDDDLDPGDILRSAGAPKSWAICPTHKNRSPLNVSAHLRDFVTGLAQDTSDRFQTRLGAAAMVDLDNVTTWVRDQGCDTVITPYAPVGPAATMIKHLRRTLPDVHIVQHRRPYDSQCWPHATHGFFKFKKAIPNLIDELGL